jgi:hypothetical protein
MDYAVLITNVEDAEAIEGTQGTASLAEALGLTEGSTQTEAGDWIYSATAEGLTGETAVLGLDVDDEPGVIYSGTPGAQCSVRVEGSIVGEGTIGGEAGDSGTLVVLRNNTVVGIAEEGFVDLGVAATYDMNVTECVVTNLQQGDVLRLAYLSDGSEIQDMEVAGGDFRIYGG